MLEDVSSLTKKVIQSTSQFACLIPDLDGMILKSIPSKWWIGHPNHDLDDFNKHPILSRIGRLICDTQLSRIGFAIQGIDWTSKPWHGLDDFSKHPILERIGPPIRDRSGWLSNPSHGLDIQSMKGLDDFPDQDIHFSQIGQYYIYAKFIKIEALHCIIFRWTLKPDYLLMFLCEI